MLPMSPFSGRDTARQCGMFRPSSDGRHSVHGPHLRSTLKPIGHLTLAFATFRHFPWSQVPLYIIVQVSASISASFALKGVFHPFMSGGVTGSFSEPWPSFCTRVHRHFNSYVYHNCRCH
ncbi:hypothetical protein GBA52_011053 [Prunus armeniaca]|nr:hypothetical protein GBA52_011053 [Prunus armeniaca]